jgi:hypothetical protein
LQFFGNPQQRALVASQPYPGKCALTLRLAFPVAKVQAAEITSKYHSKFGEFTYICVEFRQIH